MSFVEDRLYASSHERLFKLEVAEVRMLLMQILHEVVAEGGASGVEVLDHERNRDALKDSIEVTKKIPLGQCKKPRDGNVDRCRPGGFEFPCGPHNKGR